MDKKELLSKESFERILDNIPAPVWVKDTDAKYLFVNKAYCNTVVRMPDYFRGIYSSKDKVLGKTDVELFGEEEARAARISL